MTGAERGFILLTGYLGDPQHKPLTTAQLRELAKKCQTMQSEDLSRDLQLQDLLDIHVEEATAHRILDLLDRQERLEKYLQNGANSGCYPITRVSPAYPDRLALRMGLERPGVLWAKGDAAILGKPAVALVGSRKLDILNEAFAAEVGQQAAAQGYVLVSGNAKGADTVAQDACLHHGGQVISVVADALDSHPQKENVLYLSEQGYELSFSPARALSRNRVIHALPELTFVAQCGYRNGGTWDGSVQNLKHRWSPLFCLDDDSEGAKALQQEGAALIEGSDLLDISQLKQLFYPLGY